MMTQVVPESHTLHHGLVWSGPAGTCPMEPGSFFTLDHHDQTWRWLGRYYFHRDVFTDAASGQQVQFPQVFHLEDPGVEDPVCI